MGSMVSEYVKPVLTDDDSAQIKNLSPAYDNYKLLQPDNYVKGLVNQSTLYGGQKNNVRHLTLISKDAYRCTEAFQCLATASRYDRTQRALTLLFQEACGRNVWKTWDASKKATS